MDRLIPTERRHQQLGGIWKRAVFDVPVDTPEERVQFVADKYQRKAGEAYERQGYRVLAMYPPIRDLDIVARKTTAPDRKAYVIWCFVTRRPVEVHFDVDDALVPGLVKQGFRLTE